MLYSPSRSIWTPRGPELLPWLPLWEWEQGTRPWHKDAAWRPARPWYRSLDTERRMRELGIRFPGRARPDAMLAMPFPTAAARGHFSTGGAAAAPAFAGPTGFWRMEEASGSRADSAGSNTLSENGGTISSTTGHIGSAASLVGGAVHYLSGSAYTFGAGVSFTMAAWANITAFVISESARWTQTNGAFGVGFWLGDSGSGARHPRLYVRSNALKTVDDSAFTFSTATWYYVMLKYDSSAKTATIRTNDTSEATVATVTDVTAGGTFACGEGQEGIYVSQLADAAGFWLTAVSTSDITSIYNAGVGMEFYSGAWH